jgi:hypothetical protein
VADGSSGGEEDHAEGLTARCIMRESSADFQTSSTLSSSFNIRPLQMSLCPSALGEPVHDRDISLLTSKIVYDVGTWMIKKCEYDGSSTRSSTTDM